MSDIRDNSGVIIGANATISGAIGGAGANVTANVTSPQGIAEALRHIAQIEAELAALADTHEKQTMIAADISALRASVQALKPDESAFVRAADGVRRAMVMAGDTFKGAAKTLTALKAIAAALGWAALI